MKIDGEVERIVRTARPGDPVTFVVEWDTGAALERVAGLASRQERRAALQEAAEAAKEPVLSTLRGAPLIDLNEVGASQAVVVATAAEWRKLLNQPAIQEAEGRILPNAEFSAD